AERRARNAVFGPLLALCRGAVDPTLGFPSKTIAVLWAAARASCGEQAEAAVAACGRDAGHDTPEEDQAAAIAATALYDEICAAAAQGLRGRAPAFAKAVELLESGRPGDVEMFAKHLDLVPLCRGALSRLPDWVARMSDDRAAAARLAYRDAVTIAEDAGPHFIGVLYANLAEPWLILRV